MHLTSRTLIKQISFWLKLASLSYKTLNDTFMRKNFVLMLRSLCCSELFSFVSVFSFQMSELLNQRSLVQGKIPSGYLNAIFDLSGSWLSDTAETKYLAFDGYFISLYYLHLTASPLVLQEKVKKSVPAHWDPQSLSRYSITFSYLIVYHISPSTNIKKWVMQINTLSCCKALI